MRRTLLGIAAVAVLAVACGGPGGSPSPSGISSSPSASAAASGTTAPTQSAVASATSAPSDSAAPSATAAGDVTVQLATTELGDIIVDAEGRTLYGFVPDQAAGGVPTCEGECATAWPPFETEETFTVGEGLDETQFTVVDHPEGMTMLAIGDFPLYYFAGDGAPGDTNGQGLNQVWYVVGADGQLIGQE